MFFLGKATAHSTTDSGSFVTETQKQVGLLQRFWSSIDWDQWLIIALEKLFFIVFLLGLFLFLRSIGHWLIDRSYKKYRQSQKINESRLRTLYTLVINAFHYTLFFFFLYSLLTIIGVPVGSLLAGAGIAGVAIGLGAQGFMNDLITGFFIILEQQIDVGDYIRLVTLNIEGTVATVGLRTIQLKSLDGTVHYIPNRNITTISNLSRANMRVLIDVRIVPEEGYQNIVAILTTVNQTLQNEYAESIQTMPTIFGMIDLGNGNFAVRTTMYVLNGQQAKIKEVFLAHYVEALTQAGFSIPNTPIGQL